MLRDFHAFQIAKQIPIRSPANPSPVRVLLTTGTGPQLQLKRKPILTRVDPEHLVFPLTCDDPQPTRKPEEPLFFKPALATQA